MKFGLANVGMIENKTLIQMVNQCLACNDCWKLPKRPNWKFLVYYQQKRHDCSTKREKHGSQKHKCAQKVIRSSAMQRASAEDDSSVWHIFLRQRQLNNLSVDDSWSSQSLSLLLSIILGSVGKTTSVQVTVKMMNTILHAHRVQSRSCPSPKAVIHVTLSFYAVEHNAVGKNQSTNGDLGDVRSPFRAISLHGH